VLRARPTPRSRRFRGPPSAFTTGSSGFSPGIPRGQPCNRHCEGSIPIRGAVGTVDQIDERYGEHRVVVVFPGIRVPPFGTAWCDAFAESELEPIDG